MPLADMAGFVTNFFENLGVSDFAGSQVGFVTAGEVAPNSISIGRASGEDCRARRGTDSCRRITLGELNAL